AGPYLAGSGPVATAKPALPGLDAATGADSCSSHAGSVLVPGTLLWKSADPRPQPVHRDGETAASPRAIDCRARFADAGWNPGGIAGSAYAGNRPGLLADSRRQTNLGNVAGCF